MFNNLIEHTGGSLEAIIIIIIICQNCRVCNIMTLQYLRQTSYWWLQHPLWLWSLGAHIHKHYKELKDTYVAVQFPYRGCTVDLFTWGDCGSQMVAEWREYLRDDASCTLVWMRDASLFFKIANSNVNLTELGLWSVVEGQGLLSHVEGGLLWLVSTRLYLQLRIHNALHLSRSKLIGMWMKQTSVMQRRTVR